MSKISIKHWFEKQTISQKIIAIYIPLVLIPLFVLGYVANTVSSKAIIDKTSKNVSDSSKLIIEKIDSMITNAESCSNVLVFFFNRMQPREFEIQNELQGSNLNRTINYQLDMALLLFPDIESATFVDMNGNIYSTDPNIEKQTVFLEKTFLKEIDKIPTGQNKWFSMQKRAFIVSDPSKPIVSLGKKIVSIESNREIGYIILNISESRISSVFKNVGPTPGGTYKILNSNGLIISSQKSKELLNFPDDPFLKNVVQKEPSIQKIIRLDGENKLITISPFPKFQWRLVSQAPLRELTKDTRKTTIYIIFIGLICFIFTLIGASVLSKYISKPITLLSRHMLSHTDGKVGTYYHTNTTTDEVSLLASSFNTMISRINDLLTKIGYEQRKKREYELALLQSQIKPHFLYNTLEMIYALAGFGETAELKKSIKALANFYRSTLSKGKEIIDISEEVSIVQNYLYIQRIRYSDIFDFKINVSDDILRYKIPKLTIQPLVENAIYHGLKLKGSFGVIEIEGFMENGIIILKVTDDGVGIQPDRLNEILVNTPNERPKDSFGLSSVDERIKIFYGQDYGLSIKSEINKGTCITIKIPVQTQGEERNA